MTDPDWIPRGTDIEEAAKPDYVPDYGNSDHSWNPSGIDYRKELNDQQYEAVTSGPGPSLVLAGAGSGKTRTLIYRVAWLLDNGVDPENILLLTFTNKAAREMLTRVRGLLSAETETGAIWGGTFHSIGNRLLRHHAMEIGFRPGFSIMDREDQEQLLKAVIEDTGIDPKAAQFPGAAVLGEIFSYAINTCQSLGEVVVAQFNKLIQFIDQIEKIQELYEQRKKQTNLLDFDDLLVKTVQLLRDDPDLAEQYQKTFQFILVDEYQDTNRLQSDLIDLLAAHHRSVMVVGDDAQSIYSWRGANFENILQFPDRYPDAKIYRIEINYRSVPEVLEVANAAIRGNTKQFVKTLRPNRSEHATKPMLVDFMEGNQQALFVVQKIMELHGTGVPLSEVAILYRAHYQSLEVQLMLTRFAIPFLITSGLRFFEQAHIKDVAAFMKFVVNPRDEVAFKRMVRLLPGIATKGADKLWNQMLNVQTNSRSEFGKWLSCCSVGTKAKGAWKQLCYTLDELAPGGKAIEPGAMIHVILEAIYTDYLHAKYPNSDQRLEDLTTLEGFAKTFKDPVELLSQLALLSTADADMSGQWSDQSERVTLSSIHQAKGLEWQTVFVVGMADGTFPGYRAVDNLPLLEEERRLFYVAVTRAKNELFLTFPRISMNAAVKNREQRPSRFLGEIPKGLIEMKSAVR
jgi:DNA helicase II / ATP-dependent DNA helicase PcrA